LAQSKTPLAQPSHPTSRDIFLIAAYNLACRDIGSACFVIALRMLRMDIVVCLALLNRR